MTKRKRYKVSLGYRTIAVGSLTACQAVQRSLAKVQLVDDALVKVKGEWLRDVLVESVSSAEVSEFTGKVITQSHHESLKDAELEFEEREQSVAEDDETSLAPSTYREPVDREKLPSPKPRDVPRLEYRES